MKLLKIFSISLVLIISSCTKSDDSDNASNSINPPEWILGTWSNSIETGGFEFRSDDLIVLTGGILEQSYKEIVETSNEYSENAKVEEQISDSNYTFKLTVTGGITTTYSFSKLTEDEISYEFSGTETSLFKQD